MRDAHYNGVMATPQHPPEDTSDLWQAIDASLSAALGIPFSIQGKIAVSGGCISETLRLDGQGVSVFIKLGRAADAAMFAAEANALTELARTDTVRVPTVIAQGIAADRAWLAMEYIQPGQTTAAAAARLGEQLAALHFYAQSGFGWHRNNWIGTTVQCNTPEQDWPTFFARHRLQAQLDIAIGNALPQSVFERGYRLAENVPALLGNYAPLPSLLHGDLWGGNWACDEHGQPYLYDPASYIGDRDADLAMTELFGGFPDSFYRAYDAVLPRAAGYPLRRELYNLYHVLNHFNLFGAGYAMQAQAIIDKLLGETGGR